MRIQESVLPFITTTAYASHLFKGDVLLVERVGGFGFAVIEDVDVRAGNLTFTLRHGNEKRTTRTVTGSAEFQKVEVR